VNAIRDVSEQQARWIIRRALGRGTTSQRIWARLVAAGCNSDLAARLIGEEEQLYRSQERSRQRVATLPGAPEASGILTVPPATPAAQSTALPLRLLPRAHAPSELELRTFGNALRPRSLVGRLIAASVYHAPALGIGLGVAGVVGAAIQALRGALEGWPLLSILCGLALYAWATRRGGDEDNRPTIPRSPSG